MLRDCRFRLATVLALGLAGCADVKESLKTADRQISGWIETTDKDSSGPASPENASATDRAVALWDAGRQAEAVEAVQPLAAAGDADAQFLLGLAKATGRGTPLDSVEAAVWYGKAAAQGHAEAAYLLGLMHLNGSGIARDESAARARFLQAAQRPHAGALYQLGLLDAESGGTGAGLPKLERAAELGHAEAQTLVGEAYAQGRGVDRNPAWAARWLGLAARQGVADAQYQLAAHYIAGEGLPADLPSAWAWLDRAARQKHAGAGRMKTALERRLTGQELAKARSLGRVPDDRDAPTILLTQYVLSQSGYPTGAVDGLWGSQSRSALRDYQERQGLAVDGVIGPAVLSALKKEAANLR